MDCAQLGTARLDPEGYPENPGIRMTVMRDMMAPDWLRLSFEAADSGLDDAARAQAFGAIAVPIAAATTVTVAFNP